MPRPSLKAAAAVLPITDSRPGYTAQCRVVHLAAKRIAVASVAPNRPDRRDSHLYTPLTIADAANSLLRQRHGARGTQGMSRK